jgi:hypothetical protein
MISWWAVSLALPALLVALVDWRKGLFAMLLVAFLQDPARKLEADQPVYFTLLAGVVLLACFLRAQTLRPFLLTQVAGWNRYLRVPSILLLLLLVIQAGVSLIRYDNPMIVAIGALSYLGPIPALLLGYNFALKTGRSGVQWWLIGYLVCALIVLPTILLEFGGVEWATLGQVGVGIEMYGRDAALTAHSGFFRASETAAWHTATAVCLLLLLGSIHRFPIRKIMIAVVAVVALLAIGILTGRRKIFVEIVIFICCYVSLLLRFGKGGRKLALAVFIAGFVAYGALTLLVVEDPSTSPASEGVYGRYAQRSATVASDVTDRFVELGLAPVEWAIDGFGWFGGGLGVASQGAQYFGGGAEVYGGAGEGGMGKITAELGVPGLMAVIWAAVAAVRYAWQVLLFVSARSTAVARLAFGLLAFLIANLAVFFVATQVFGDLFILTMLGLLSGFFLATPALAERERAQSAAVRAPVRQRPLGAPVFRQHRL